MIIVKLMGGIGNQMFQYATARRLAHIHNTNLKLDLSWFDTAITANTCRSYVLDKFMIKDCYATIKEIKELTIQKSGIVRSLITIFFRRDPVVAPSYVKEKQFNFEPEVLQLPDNVYLDGYWQSDNYFADIDNIIRTEFTVHTIQQGRNLELAELISSSNSVSLHMRRGDYVSNPETRKFHGTCDLNYYYRCTEQLTKKVKEPHFFVFSDDNDWVRDNLKLPYTTTLVDHNGEDKNYEDLRLMSQCKHHIIANSSFSWWGAWLCNNPEKIIFAPRKWFNVDYLNSTRLMPESWCRV